MKRRVDWVGIATRVAFVAAGVIAGILLALKGQLEALPGLALGGTLGACFITRLAD